jgi:hypothetical protein
LEQQAAGGVLFVRVESALRLALRLVATKKALLWNGVDIHHCDFTAVELFLTATWRHFCHQ